MLLRQIVKGPQIHFWVSEKTVPDREPKEACCPAGDGKGCCTDSQSAISEKGQPLSNNSHVEIF